MCWIKRVLHCYIGVISMYNDKITTFRLLKDNTYKKIYLDNLYFENNKGVNISQNGVNNVSTGFIIIPTTSEIDIKEKDYVVDGYIEDVLDENNRLKHLQQKYQVYTVLSIDDCRKGGLPHWEVTLG